MKNAMAVAMRIRGDYAAFFNCCFHGFQDTLMDDAGKHLYKDCYVEGTVDFIFGSGQSLYLVCNVITQNLQFHDSILFLFFKQYCPH